MKIVMKRRKIKSKVVWKEVRELRETHEEEVDEEKNNEKEKMKV